MIVKRKARKNTERVKAENNPVPVSNIIFNMNNEMAYAYSLCNVCDKSIDSRSTLSITSFLLFDTEEPDSVPRHR